jgi:hypothetical protein
MYFHGARGASGDTQAAGDAFSIIKNYHSGFGIQLECAGGANGNTSAALCTAVFITGYILAQR